jgi:hypothetical protein
LNTQSPNTAAGEHFGNAGRLIAALPLVRRRADRDRQVQVALVHATLTGAAGMLGEWKAVADRENHQEPPA